MRGAQGRFRNDRNLTGRSERPDRRQNNDSKQQNDRDLIKPAIPDMRVPVSVVFEIKEQFAAVNVVDNQGQYTGQFELQPESAGIGFRAEGKQGPEAEYQRENRAGSHDAKKQFALHDLEAIDGDLIGTHGMIDKQPGQIEQTGKPGHHEDNMQCLDPEHSDQQQATSY